MWPFKKRSTYILKSWEKLPNGDIRAIITQTNPNSDVTWLRIGDEWHWAKTMRKVDFISTDGIELEVKWAINKVIEWETKNGNRILETKEDKALPNFELKSYEVLPSPDMTKPNIRAVVIDSNQSKPEEMIWIRHDGIWHWASNMNQIMKSKLVTGVEKSAQTSIDRLDKSIMWEEEYGKRDRPINPDSPDKEAAKNFRKSWDSRRKSCTISTIPEQRIAFSKAELKLKDKHENGHNVDE